MAAFYSYITKTCNRMVRHCQPLNLKRIFSSALFFSCSSSCAVFQVGFLLFIKMSVRRGLALHIDVFYSIQIERISPFRSFNSRQQINEMRIKNEEFFFRARSRFCIRAMHTRNAYTWACEFPLQVKNEKEKNKIKRTHRSNSRKE